MKKNEKGITTFSGDGMNIPGETSTSISNISAGGKSPLAFACVFFLGNEIDTHGMPTPYYSYPIFASENSFSEYWVTIGSITDEAINRESKNSEPMSNEFKRNNTVKAKSTKEAIDIKINELELIHQGLRKIVIWGN